MSNEKFVTKKKAIFFIVVSAFCFALMAFFVFCSGDLPVAQKGFFRNFVAFFIAIVVCRKNHIHFSGKLKNFFGLLARSFFGTLGIFANYYAIDKLNLSDASILNKMSPFFAVLASVFILGEKINLKQFLIVFFAFCGSLFVVKPSSQIFSNNASLVGLLGGISAGIAYCFVRFCAKNGEKSEFIVLFFSFFSSLFFIPFFAFRFVPMTKMQVVFLFLAGLSASGGQFFITKAYSLAAAKEISIFDYSIIIFSGFLGFVFMGQIPDIFSVVGYIIIILMAFFQTVLNVNQTNLKV